MQNYQAILDFWFYPQTHEKYGEKRAEWFKKDAEFDHLIKSTFEETFLKAEKGDLLAWTNSAEGCLALILLFDQFSRNMYREDPKSFATDGKAREIARHMLANDFFEKLPAFQKNFVALPFEHSEDLKDQEYSLELFNSFADEEAILYAVRHHEIIEQFGRFPHRNDVLDRQSTDEEIAFLNQPNSSF